MIEAESLEFCLFWTTLPFLVVGFIGNVMVIRIVHKTRHMHTPTNYLIANMAFSDVMSILLWPLYVFEVGIFVCKFLALTEISIMVSSITLTVVAVERYHALLKPFITGLRLQQQNSRLAIACIWIASVTVCFPEFIFKDWSETHSKCIGPWTLDMNQASKVYVIINSSLTLLQMAVMFYCYGSLIRGLYFTDNVWPETVGERSSEKKKLVVTFILAATGFSVGYTPTVVFYTVVAAGDDGQLSSLLSVVFDFVFAFSLCLNPILYAFRSKKFQEGFKHTVLCRKPESLQNEIHLA